jgi:hypothetical protein
MPGKPSASDPHIKVSFRQSGGVGGLILGADLDTASLPPREAAQLRSLVQATNVASTPADDTEGRMSPPDARDLTQYEIEVTTKKGTRRLAFDDMSVPAKVEPLLQFLRSRARARPLR